MSILADEIEHEGGGFCPNSTIYCNFGCCGDYDHHHCCFPFGVFIGCGFGVLGTICLLISICRCRLGRQSQMQYSDTELHFGPEFGRENQMYMSVGSAIASISESVDCPKYSNYVPPPSYDEAIADTDRAVIENGNT